MRLVTLGRLALEPSGFSRPKPLLLLAYLALQGPQPRRVLADIFWMGARNPADSLSTALRHLKKEIGPDLCVDGHQVGTRVSCDAQEFLARVGAGDDTALELYAGSFLAGLALPLGVELEEWVYDTRELMAGHARILQRRRAQRALAQGDRARAGRQAEAAFQVAGAPPLEPEEAARLARILVATGSPLAARASAEADGYDAEPSASTVTSAAALRSVGSFVGRSRELALLEERLLDPDVRLVTLLGPGGIGKTRLALRAAERLAPRFTAVHVVSLEAVTTIEGVATALLAAVGARSTDEKEPLTAVARRLREGSCLVVLDDAERVTEAVGDALAVLLPSCPDLTLLVTSRQRLQLRSEWVVPLGGLAVPAPTERVEAAGSSDAVHLFVARARQVAPSAGFGPEDLAAVAAVCRQVGGSPLAVELAAGWTRALTPAQIAVELEADLGLLKTTARDVPERHRSVTTLFAGSWRLLGEAERRAACAVAVFAAPFDVEGARCAGADRTVLVDLVDRSLLRSLPGGRFEIHPLLRRYLRDRLRERPEEEDAALRAHARYHLQRLSRRAGRAGGDAGALDSRFDDLAAALVWVAQREPDAILGAVPSLWRYLHTTARFREALSVCDRMLEVLEGSGQATAAAVGVVTSLRAGCLWWLSRYDEGAAEATEGVRLLRSAGHASGLLFGFTVLGGNLWKIGRYDRARDAFVECLAMTPEGCGTRSRRLLNIAQVDRDLGHLERARSLLEEAARLDRHAGNDDFLIAVLASSALVYSDLGEAQRARELAEEARHHAEAANDRLLQVLDASAHVALRAGDSGAARRHAERALALAEHAGNLEHRSGALLTTSDLELLEGAIGGARTRLEDAFHFVRALPLALRCCALLAKVLEQEDALAASTRLLAWVETRPEAERAVLVDARRTLEHVRARLPETDFVSAWRDGRRGDARSVLDGTGCEAWSTRLQGWLTPPNATV